MTTSVFVCLCLCQTVTKLYLFIKWPQLYVYFYETMNTNRCSKIKLLYACGMSIDPAEPCLDGTANNALLPLALGFSTWLFSVDGMFLEKIEFRWFFEKFDFDLLSRPLPLFLYFVFSHDYFFENPFYTASVRVFNVNFPTSLTA